MEQTPRDRYSAAIIASDIERTGTMEKELDVLEEKYRSEISDIENDRINENGVEEGQYLNDQEKTRMDELQLIQKTYTSKQNILEGRITQASKDFYNQMQKIMNSKSIFDI